MTAAANSRRVVHLLAALLCVALAGWAGLYLTSRIAQTRDAALQDAGDAVQAATSGLIEQQSVPTRLVAGVENLLARPALGLSYITLRNTHDATLVSRGRLGAALSWLPAGQAQQWRGLLYRFGSAETSQRLTRESRPVGATHFGVSWGHVFARAGMPLLTWFALLAAALAGLYSAVLRLRSDPAAAKQDAGARVRKPARTARVSLGRLRPRSLRGDTGFAPIAAAPRAAATSRKPPETPEPVVPPAEVADSAPAKLEPASAEDAPPVVGALADGPVADTSATAGVEADKPPAAAPASHSVTAHTVIAPRTTSASSVAERAGTQQFHAPRVDAEPHLGDSTLDIRFYPVWRDGERKILAGAWAALAWRTGESELVDADTLTRLAAKDGALRAFTQWIARRFSLLHGNWRTLELSTVPILLSIPSAMLAFADAEAVWRDALRRTDRDTNDLILRLSPPSGAEPHATLPVRRALPLERPDAPLPPDCDVLCVRPDQLNGDIDTWRACFASASRPVLFGPISNPADWSALIEHERVSWFSASADNLHTPRSFARLLTRYRTEPV